MADEKPLEAPGVARNVVRVLRWTAIAVGGLLVALVLIVGAAMVLAIPIDLSPLRDRIEATASTTLARPFQIEGPLVLVPTLAPALRVEGVRVGNPAGWPESDLARLRRAHVRVAILPLLRGEVRIDELAVEGLELRLERDSAGESNWLFHAPAAATEEVAVHSTPALRFIELRQLRLRDVSITHRDSVAGTTRELSFIDVTGAAERERPMRLAIEGTLQQLSYQATATGGNLAALLEGSGPWPLDLSIAAAGASLQLAGTVTEPLRVTGYALDFEFVVPTTQELKAVLGMTQAPIDSVALRGHFTGGKGRYRFDGLEGRLGDTDVTGHLEADMTGSKPRVVGALHAPRVDVEPFYTAVAEGEYGSSEDLGPPGSMALEGATAAEVDEPDEQGRALDLDAPFLAIGPLALFDADISLAVDEVVGSRASLRNASLGLKVADGRLTAPVAVTYANVPFTGRVTLGSSDGIPEASVSLTALGSEIGELAELLVDAKGIEGRFDYAKLDLSARGETLRALVESSELSSSLSNASLSYGHDTDGEPVEFSVDRADLYFPAAQSSRIVVSGALLGEPFAIETRGGTFLEKFVAREWPIEITASGGGARLSANGVLAPEGETRIAVDLAGERIGGLARWIGFSPDATAPYQLDGELIVSDTLASLRILDGRLANTRFRGEVGVRQYDETPVTLLTLEADVIDLDRLLALLPEPTEAKEPMAGEEPYAIDVPILPKGIELLDSDIDLSIQRLETKPVPVSRLVVSSQIRGGYMDRAPFQAVIAGASLRGYIGVDLRADLPKLNLEVASKSLDVGELLQQLGLVNGLEITAERFTFSAAIEGASKREMLSRSEFSASVQGGLWRVRDSDIDGSLDIAIGTGRVVARGRQPMALTLDGRIDQTPVRIKLKTDPLASYAQRKERLRVDAGIALERAHIQLSGIAPTPVRTDDLHFRLALRGQRFSDFDELLSVSLPPWGPYALRGEFGTRETGYYISGLQMNVGESDLSGNMELTTAQMPPRLVAEFAADSIQLDDFDTEGWSVQGEAQQADAVIDRHRASDKARALLSPAVMRSLAGKLSIRVKEVLSGEDRLGEGRLDAVLEGGRLSVNPLTVAVPGGTVDVTFALEPTEADIALSATAKIEQLDYGYLARRIDPVSNVAGLISVDADVTTRGPNLANVMYHSNGHIDFAIWPEGLNAGVFDLWATNLLIQVLPLVDPSARSKVNCFVARFQLEDGIMRPSTLLVDTTRVQASGDGVIDFKSRTVDFLVGPRPKRPQLFSAETPLGIRGDFTDFSVGASPGSVLGTTIRIITSPVVVPLQWVFTERPPADGKVACQRAWEEEPPAATPPVKTPDATFVD